MDRLIAGERDPKALAECARTRARAQDPPAARGAGGRGVLHRPITAALLQVHPDADRLGSTAEIDAAVRGDRANCWPRTRNSWQQAESMPGWARRVRPGRRSPRPAPDMTRFPTPGHLASWAGRTPVDQPVRQPARARRRPRNAATSTSARSPARPPSRPARPRPAKAPATGAWSAGAARPKPASPPATPRCASTTRCYPTPACDMRTSAADYYERPAQHRPAGQPPRRRARPASATKSPSANKPDPGGGHPGQPDPPPIPPPSADGINRRRLLPRARLEVHFSAQLTTRWARNRGCQAANGA